jgi:hypothetical protein
MMTWLIYCIIFSSFAKQSFPGSLEIVEDNRCFNDLKKSTKLAHKHTHLRWCELLEIGDFSRKLRLRWSCHFPWYALAPSFLWSALLCRINICECARARACVLSEASYCEYLEDIYGRKIIFGSVISKFSLIQQLTIKRYSYTMKTYVGSGSIDPLILELGTSWRWMITFMPRPFDPRGQSCR